MGSQAWPWSKNWWGICLCKLKQRWGNRKARCEAEPDVMNGVSSAVMIPLTRYKAYSARIELGKLSAKFSRNHLSVQSGGLELRILFGTSSQAVERVGRATVDGTLLYLLCCWVGFKYPIQRSLIESVRCSQGELGRSKHHQVLVPFAPRLAWNDGCFEQLWAS